MHKLVIIFVVVYVVSTLFGNFLLSLLNVLTGTVPFIFGPLTIFLTFFKFTFETMFSNYYVSILLNIMFFFSVLNVVLSFLIGKASAYYASAPARKVAKLKQQEVNNKRLLSERNKNAKTIVIGNRKYKNYGSGNFKYVGAERYKDSSDFLTRGNRSDVDSYIKTGRDNPNNLL